MRNLFIVAAAALITVGCSDSPTAPDPTPMPTPTPAATFSDVQSQVFDASCVIHHGSPATGGLDLRSPQSFANLVNVGSPVSGISFVIPNDADGSYLVQKLEGSAGIQGEQMLFGGTPISATLMQLVRDWINGGALNN
jgi:hypothetical protein